MLDNTIVYNPAFYEVKVKNPGNKISAMNINALDEMRACLADLPKKGDLVITSTDFVYLKINDDYIHKTFPVIRDLYPSLSVPNYFNEPKAIGAHISVAYPHEIKEAKFAAPLRLTFDFTLGNVFFETIENKTYCGILVDSIDLESLRIQNNLPKLLNFKNIDIGFHITLATRG